MGSNRGPGFEQRSSTRRGGNARGAAHLSWPAMARPTEYVWCCPTSAQLAGAALPSGAACPVGVHALPEASTPQNYLEAPPPSTLELRSRGPMTLATFTSPQMRHLPTTPTRGAHSLLVCALTAGPPPRTLTPPHTHAHPPPPLRVRAPHHNLNQPQRALHQPSRQPPASQHGTPMRQLGRRPALQPAAGRAEALGGHRYRSPEATSAT